MTRAEHLLTILSEECAEVSQTASKALRFGLNDKQPGQEFTNAERIVNEFNDVMAIIDMLADDLHIPEIYADLSMIRAKKKKVEEYLKYSRTQGTLREHRNNKKA